MRKQRGVGDARTPPPRVSTLDFRVLRREYRDTHPTCVQATRSALPTYEYHCESCGKNYDLTQSFSAETQHTCEECGKGVAKRVLHAPRVVFKGSGWYATDSRNTSVATSDDSSSSSSESPSSDAGSTDSGDSKIETSAAG